MSDTLIDLLERFIPSYLANPSRENLKAAIRRHFPDSDPASIVYSLNEDSRLLQGDCLDEIPFQFLKEGNVLYFAGIVLSNSCSIEPTNSRLEQNNVNFAQVYSLSEYEKFLTDKDIESEKIKNHIKELKANSIAGIFYLPELQSNSSDEIIFPESFARLDRISSIPQSVLQNYNLKYKPEGDKFFTLSNYGFYLFIFKLSVNFCRFSENIDRDAFTGIGEQQ